MFVDVAVGLLAVVLFRDDDSTLTRSPGAVRERADALRERQAPANSETFVLGAEAAGGPHD